MTIHVLKGSKQEIADTLVRFGGDVREAIVFVDEPDTPQSPNAAAANAADALFDEMRPFMVDAADLDDSRDAICTRGPGE